MDGRGCDQGDEVGNRAGMGVYLGLLKILCNSTQGGPASVPFDVLIL